MSARWQCRERVCQAPIACWAFGYCRMRNKLVAVAEAQLYLAQGWQFAREHGECVLMVAPDICDPSSSQDSAGAARTPLAAAPENVRDGSRAGSRP